MNKIIAFIINFIKNLDIVSSFKEALKDALTTYASESVKKKVSDKKKAKNNSQHQEHSSNEKREEIIFKTVSKCLVDLDANTVEITNTTTKTYRKF